MPDFFVSGYRICSRCIMDTSDSEILFDDQGICNHCRSVEKRLRSVPFNLPREEKQAELQKKIAAIKAMGRNRKYDCLIGVSGGLDSSYVAYLVKKLGLRPLAGHLDNGWDTEIAIRNIENLCRRLDIDLYTHVIRWEEFLDLQLAFLKASTPDSEIPTDHAIHGFFYQVAAKFRIPVMISGVNHLTESILPRTWSHGHTDWKYIRSVNRLFGGKPLKTYPHVNYLKWSYYKLIRRIRYFAILDYVDFVREEAIETLQKETGWQSYGGKHSESQYTKFFQNYILPVKFGIEKRRAHLSSLICAGQMSREQALKEMAKKVAEPGELRLELQFVLKKLGISQKEFQSIMSLPKKTFWDYPSYEKSRLAGFIRAIYHFFD